MGRIDPEICRLKDGTEITLRTAVEQDAAPLLATVLEYIAENEGMSWAPDEYRKTVDDRRDFIRRKLDHPAEILILAELDEEIVANIDFHVGNRQRTAHTGEFGMGMLPKVRSRGLGTLLLNRLIVWARTVPQLEKINLRVIANNPRAMGLYRKLGFLEEGRRVREIKYSDGTYADEILMGKLLSRARYSPGKVTKNHFLHREDAMNIVWRSGSCAGETTEQDVLFDPRCARAV